MDKFNSVAASITAKCIVSHSNMQWTVKDHYRVQKSLIVQHMNTLEEIISKHKKQEIMLHEFAPILEKKLWEIMDYGKPNQISATQQRLSKLVDIANQHYGTEYFDELFISILK